MIAPEFGTDIVAKKSKSPIAKQVVRKKRKGKKNSSKKQMNLQDEEHESHESAHEGLPNEAPVDSILRFDISKGFVSSQSSSESEFSDSESGYRHRIRYVNFGSLLSSIDSLNKFGATKRYLRLLAQKKNRRPFEIEAGRKVERLGVNHETIAAVFPL